MKKILTGVVLAVICIAMIALVVGVAMKESKVEFEAEEQVATDTVPTVSQSEYDERVRNKMEETRVEWEEKHNLWAQQEVSKEIIIEQQNHLKALNEREVSLQ